MTIYLLDVNMLLALSDPMHIHHEAAHRWFAAGGQSAWATCPITENGFVRIASHPNYPNRPGDAPVVLAMLRQFCAVEGHHFWPDDISIRDAFHLGALVTHTQITDVFLLALAVSKGGKLTTLDRRISTAAVQNGGEALELVNS
ncbi:MAG TPA: TA system VapC family ribonuclease toxin [Roseiflexaceae bacterium]